MIRFKAPFSMPSLRALLTHSVTKNAAALYGIQFAGYIVPLVTLPYLARVLGPAGFGLLLFSQSFALWASLTVEYGFNLSATRDVARDHNNNGDGNDGENDSDNDNDNHSTNNKNEIKNKSKKEALANIAAGVLGAKVMLLAGLVVIAVVTGASVPAFRQHPLYFICALLQTLAFGFSPFWYFQGIESMVRAVLVETICRTSATAFVFVLIRAPGDGWKVLALQALAGCTTLTIQTLWMYREVEFRWPNVDDSRRALRSGWDMFIFRGAYQIYGTANAFILGLFAGSIQAVGYFGGAERIARALQGLTTPFTQALYPHMSQAIARSRSQGARTARWTMTLACGIGITLALLLGLRARLIVTLILGSDYGPSVPVLYVLALVLAINGFNSSMIMQWMLPSGMERLVGRITLGAIAINLIVAATLAPARGPIGMAWAMLMAETCKAGALTTVLLRAEASPANGLAPT
jgi:PST family polysaccharide transporter